MIFIVGTDHRQQRRAPQILSTSEALLRIEREQKERYTQILQRYLAQPGRWFVGEEIEHDVPTFAMELARPPHTYWNIDMSREQRNTAGIPLDYAEEGGNDRYTAEQTGRWNQEREEFMFAEIQERRGDADRLLIICGAQHAEPIANLFRNRQELPEVIDLRTEPWFVADWLRAYMEGDEL